MYNIDDKIITFLPPKTIEAEALEQIKNKDTNWEAWRSQLFKELTRQHKIMYPGNTFNGEILKKT